MSSTKLNNRYFLLGETTPHNFPTQPFDPFDDHTWEWGLDFYVDVFRALERSGAVKGVTFLLAYGMPERLPLSGPDVALVIVGDESFGFRPYLLEVGAILRAYGGRPVYVEGFPLNALRRSALMHYLYKRLIQFSTVSPALRYWQAFKDASCNTLHLPIGTFARFDPQPKPMSERSIDYAFLGSLAFDEGQRKFAHRFFRSPKILSRRQMVKALESARGTGTSRLLATSDFSVSIQNKTEYVDTLADTKISLVPRGTSLETYRYFESLKAGCVIICEALPSAWFYDDHPGYVIKDWSLLPSLLRNLLNDPDQLQARSDAAIAFYQARCQEDVVANHIAQFLAAPNSN